MTHATIVGARGYLGRELVRLLHEHPKISQLTPVSGSATGSVGAAVPGLAATGLDFVDIDSAEATAADIVFLAVPSGKAADLVRHFEDAGATLIIDLSRDHRLAAIEEDGWHYGLADIDPPRAGTRRIANPGCYPTAAMLGIRALQAAACIAEGPIIVDGKSGVSGAGAAPRSDLHFPEANESVRAYAVDGHDHVDEMAGVSRSPVRFTPHLVPQTRGLLATVYAPAVSGIDQAQIDAALDVAFSGSPFVDRCEEPDTAHVRGSNRALVAAYLDPSGIIVIRCAIDNLVKGGAGQAVHNMNLAKGWDPQTGLSIVGLS